jgi:hypothetical protein
MIDKVKIPMKNIDDYEVHIAKLQDRIYEYREALRWCGGSADFNEGGQARKGWLKICEPLTR